MRIAAAVVSIGLAAASSRVRGTVADATRSEPGLCPTRCLRKGSVGNIVGAPMREAVRPGRSRLWVELPACNNCGHRAALGYDDPTWRRSHGYHADVRH